MPLQLIHWCLHEKALARSRSYWRNTKTREPMINKKTIISFNAPSLFLIWWSCIAKKSAPLQFIYASKWLFNWFNDEHPLHKDQPFFSGSQIVIWFEIDIIIINKEGHVSSRGCAWSCDCMRNPQVWNPRSGVGKIHTIQFRSRRKKKSFCSQRQDPVFLTASRNDFPRLVRRSCWIAARKNNR